MAERVWRATAAQRRLLRLDHVDEVLYGGARGGGKSDTLLVFSIRRRVRHPGSRGLILRRTLADLTKGGALIPRSHELLAGIATWNGSEHRWRFANGSTLEFGHAQDDADVYAYQGAQYDDICIDQLDQFDEWQYLLMLAACRTVLPGVRPLVRVSANPGGRGHAWIKARWVDVVPPGEVYTDSRTGLTRCYVPATVADNPYLNESYVRWLEALPEPWRTAWRDGRWDVFVGQYFASWDPAVHVCEPFPVPERWPRWMAYDWGAASPAWWGWFVRAPWGTIYVYRELYLARYDEPTRRWVGLGLTVDEQVRRALAMQAPGEVARPCYAGPDMFTRGAQSGETNAAVAARLGLPMLPAMTDRVQGWQRIQRALQPRPVDREGATVVEPELVVFSGCQHLIRTLPLLVANERHPDDLADGQEDHPADGLRYGLVMQHTTDGAPAPVLLGPPRSAMRDGPWGGRRGDLD